MSEDLGSAESKVEIITLPGCERQPNTYDLRFGRLLTADRIPRMSAGSSCSRTCPSLIGDVGIGSFFLGGDGRRWKDDEVAQGMRSLMRASEWLVMEANRHGIGMNLRVLDTYLAAIDPEPLPRETEIQLLPEGDGEGYFEADAETRMIASAGRASRLLGFTDLIDASRDIASRVGCDEFVWIIHVRLQGRSFAVPQSFSRVRGANLSFCFAREDSFTGSLRGKPYVDVATLAHELLHLFGATDKYAVPLMRFPPGQVSRNDVMRLETTSLSELVVGPMTAREVGWTQ